MLQLANEYEISSLHALYDPYKLVQTSHPRCLLAPNSHPTLKYYSPFNNRGGGVVSLLGEGIDGREGGGLFHRKNT